MKESRFYEVKEKISNTFLKTVSAYANFGSGKIVFGIDDNGTIVGVEDTKAACLDIENKINDSMKPVPEYTITVDSKTNVITIVVSEGMFKPYYYKSKAYKRNDTATIEVERRELNRLILEGENRTFDDLQSKDQALHFAVLEEKMRSEIHVDVLNKDILRTLGVIDGGGKYNNAGALLADKNSFNGIDCTRFGETIDIILDREILSGNSILKQYDDVISLYRKYYQYDEIKGMIRKTIETIPEKAFRETIANALVHREWDISSNIRVAMYEDRIEVFSPGGLPKGMTEEDYLMGQVSLLRNPIIAGVFFRLHLIESFGTGIQRINAAYTGSDVKPMHTFSSNTIKVTLPVIASSEGLEGSEKIVYEALNRVGKSSSEIMNDVGFGKNKILNILSSLEEKGYVQKIGKARGTKYRVVH